MPQHYEILPFSSTMPMHCVMQHVEDIDNHMHNFFELDFLISGKARMTLDSQVKNMQAGDIIGVNPLIPHEIHSTGCVMILLQFDQSVIEATLPHPVHPQFDCDSTLQPDNPAYDTLRRLIARIVQNNADHRAGYELRNWSMIYEITDLMYNRFRVAASDAGAAKAHRYADRIARITAYIGDHYREPLTLSEVAEHVYLSAPYLSKFFEQHFGMSFLNYVSQLRLNFALDLLAHSDETIEQIAADSGFPNSHAFVLAFRKEYNINPSAWRRKKLKNTSVSAEAGASELPVFEQTDYMSGLRKYLAEPEEHPVNDSSQIISGNADFSVQEPLMHLKHTWRDTFAVGSARDFLYADIIKMVRRLQDAIGFQYVRFTGIFSDELRVVAEGAEGNLIYSFVYTDKIFDTILSLGLKPMVDLSFMPRLLAKDPTRLLFNDLISEPADNQQWAELVQAFLLHLMKRYGSGALHSWRFSVWHQPDTPTSLYGFSNAKAFYTFYKTTYDIIKTIDPEIPVGSPSTFYITDEKYTNWFIPFVSWCRENQCMPDFLCFNFYDTIVAMKSSKENESARKSFGFVGYMTLNKDENGFAEFVRSLKRTTRQAGLTEMPLYLTEWNNTPSQQDLLNDTCFKSCYIVKSILENYDRIDSYTYWSLTDWMSETSLKEELFSGGIGLFTKNGIPKASFYAFALMRFLKDDFLGRGEGWFATGNASETVIMLYNYRHFSQLYAKGERFDMTFTDRYTPFHPEQTMDMHLTIHDLPDGEYVITELILNRQYGSSFDTWVASGAMEFPGKQNYADYLDSISRPHMQSYKAVSENGVMELDAMLDMLEVRTILIRPSSLRSPYGLP